MKTFVKNVIVTVVMVLGVDAAFAQTTLPAGSDVAGDFSVGSTAARGNLSVTGKTGNNTGGPALGVTGTGGVLFEGIPQDYDEPGLGQIPATGVGSRFMWYPKKAAMRVGYIESYPWLWDDNFIGYGSFATSESYAAGQSSVALASAYADGVSSVAMSMGQTGASWATGMSGGTAGGTFSVAMGYVTYSIGSNSLAASGGLSGGSNSLAVSGGYSMGDYSAAIGYGTWSESFRSVVVGSCSAPTVGVVSATAWVDTDPIFVVGNGTGNPSDAPEIQYRSALTIYKNGKIKMERQGDILMGDFGTSGSGD